MTFRISFTPPGEEIGVTSALSQPSTSSHKRLMLCTITRSIISFFCRSGVRVVVKIDGYNAVFDPSYGELYTGTSMDAAERAWEDKALAGGGGWRWRYFEADQNGNTKDANGNKIFQNGPVKPHQPDRPAGQRETRFSS